MMKEFERVLIVKELSFKKSDARYFVEKIKCHCDFIMIFLAISYFILQISQTKNFKIFITSHFHWDIHKKLDEQNIFS